MDDKAKAELHTKLDLKVLTNDSNCISEVARFIIEAFSNAEAKLVVDEITKIHFPVNEKPDAPNLDKKYLLFYIAHEVIFKSLDRGSSDLEDRFAWVRAIGDNLTQWVASLVLVQKEHEFYRLQEMNNLFELWAQNSIYSKGFISTIKRFYLPAFEIAREVRTQEQLKSSLGQEASVNGMMLEVSRHTVTREAMQYEAAERELKAEEKLKAITTKIESLTKLLEKSQEKEPLLRQLEDVENQLTEIRSEQLKQIKHGIQLSKAISDIVADVR